LQKAAVSSECSVLASAPNRMLNTRQWCDLQDVVGFSQFWTYKEKAKAYEWVRRLTSKEMREVKLLPGEAERLRLDSGPNVAVWTVTDKWLRGGM